jgi:hypothetical protein
MFERYGLAKRMLAFEHEQRAIECGRTETGWMQCKRPRAKILKEESRPQEVLGEVSSLFRIERSLASFPPADEYGSTDHLLDRSAVVHRVLKKRRVGVAMERAYTLSDVEEAVCRMTRIDREELRRTQRKPALKRARELFMYLGAVIRGRVCVK